MRLDEVLLRKPQTSVWITQSADYPLIMYLANYVSRVNSSEIVTRHRHSENSFSRFRSSFFEFNFFNYFCRSIFKIYRELYLIALVKTVMKIVFVKKGGRPLFFYFDFLTYFGKTLFKKYRELFEIFSEL